MALIECNECGTQVSDKASKCPNCGNPLKPSKINGIIDLIKSNLVGYICLLIAIVALFLAVILANENWWYADWRDGEIYLGSDFSTFLVVTLVFFVSLWFAMKKLFPNLSKFYYFMAIIASVLFTTYNFVESKNDAERCSKIIIKNNEEEKANTIEGKYKFTDKRGTTYILEVNSDETAVIYDTKYPDTKCYGSWRKFGNMQYAQLRFEYAPKAEIFFDRDVCGAHYICITPEWVYSGNSAAKAKNPHLRLPLTKL